MKKIIEVEKIADYAISTLGYLYICTVNAFWFWFYIVREGETREKDKMLIFFWEL